MKVKSQMLNNNRVTGLHPKYKSSQSLKEKGKQQQPKKKISLSPGHQHVPKVSVLSELQNQQRRMEKSWSDGDAEFQTLVPPMTFKSTQRKFEGPIQKVLNSQASLLQPVNKPFRVNFHPDDGFYSGAWLFDLDVAPKWFKRELKQSAKVEKNTNEVALMKWMKELETNPMPNTWTPLLTDEEQVFETSGAWLFNLKEMPLWFQKQVQSPTQIKRQTNTQFGLPNFNTTNVTLKKESIPPTISIPFPHFINRFSIQQNQEDDTFYSGAWLFDESVAPHWLQSALTLSPKPKNDKKLKIVHSDAILKKSFNSLPHHQQPLFDKLVDEYELIESGAWLFDLASAPSWFQSLIPQACILNQTKDELVRVVLRGFSYHTTNEHQLEQVVYLKRVPIPYPKSIIHEEIGFYSGAWLFNMDMAPFWFKEALSTTATSPTKVTRFSSADFFSNIDPNTYQISPQPFPTLSSPTSIDFKLRLYCNPSLASLPIQKNKTQAMNPSSSSIRHIYNQAQLSEIDFNAGAWLFDQTRVPDWMPEEVMQPFTRPVQHPRQAPPNQRRNNGFWKALKRPFWFIAYY